MRIYKIAQFLDSLVKQYSVDPESVPVKGWVGRVMFHGTSKEGAQDIMNSGIDNSKSQKGYFGRGFYMASDYDLAKGNYADWAEEDEEGSVLVVKISEGANILDLRDSEDSEVYSRVSEHGRLCGRDDFDLIMTTNGIDGLFDRSFGGIVIYDPSVLTVLGVA